MPAFKRAFRGRIACFGVANCKLVGEVIVLGIRAPSYFFFELRTINPMARVVGGVLIICTARQYRGEHGDAKLG
jgi:hypothetical protein